MATTTDAAPGGPATKRRRTLRIAVQGCCHGELDRIYAAVEHLARQQLPPRDDNDPADNADADANDNPSSLPRPAVDLLIIAGDFQAFRNLDDVETMACPPKYRRLGGFWRYYSGAAVAPVPTVFVGGNHEASAYMQELPFGGWVAPNIYYLGDAGAVRFGGLRLAGVSGIWAQHDYPLARWERPPYTPSSLRSVYHVRRTDVHRLLRLAGGGAGAGGGSEGGGRGGAAGGGGGGGGGAAGAAAAATADGAAAAAATTATATAAAAPHSSSFADVFVSHDWPQHITRHGDAAALFRRKPYFRAEASRGELGSPPLQRLLEALRPRLWFAAHLHVKFPAIVRHDGGGRGGGAGGIGTGAGAGAAGAGAGATADNAATTPTTRFLALDKCLPGRDFLQIVEVDDLRSDDELRAAGGPRAPVRLEYDEEWLAVLRGTWRLGQGATATGLRQPPAHAPPGGWDDPSPPGPDAADLQAVRAALEARFGPRPAPRFLPENFAPTAPAHPLGSSSGGGGGGGGKATGSMPRGLLRNPQTTALLELLGLPADCLDPPPEAAAAAAAMQQQSLYGDGGGGPCGGWGGGGGGGGAAAGAAAAGLPGPPPGPRPMPVPAVLDMPWLPPRPTTAVAAAAAARNNPEAIDIDDDDEEEEAVAEGGRQLGRVGAAGWRGSAPAPQQVPAPPAAWLAPATTAAAAAAAARHNPEEIDIDDAGEEEEED
jgi:lariat debranching enzyme